MHYTYTQSHRRENSNTIPLPGASTETNHSSAKLLKSPATAHTCRCLLMTCPQPQTPWGTTESALQSLVSSWLLAKGQSHVHPLLLARRKL